MGRLEDSGGMMDVSDGRMGTRMGRWLTLAFTVLKNFAIFRVYDVDGFLEAGDRMFMIVFLRLCYPN